MDRPQVHDIRREGGVSVGVASAGDRVAVGREHRVGERVCAGDRGKDQIDPARVRAERVTGDADDQSVGRGTSREIGEAPGRRHPARVGEGRGKPLGEGTGWRGVSHSDRTRAGSRADVEGTDVDVRSGGGTNGCVVIGDTGDRYHIRGEDRVGESIGQGHRGQHNLNRATVCTRNNSIGQTYHEPRVIGESSCQIGEASRSENSASIGERSSEIFRVSRGGSGVGCGQRPRAEGVPHMDRGKRDIGGDRARGDRVSGARVCDHVGSEGERGRRVDHREGGRSRRRAGIRHRKREGEVGRSAGCQDGYVCRGDHGRGGVAGEGDRCRVGGVDRVGDTHRRSERPSPDMVSAKVDRVRRKGE